MDRVEPSNPCGKLQIGSGRRGGNLPRLLLHPSSPSAPGCLPTAPAPAPALLHSALHGPPGNGSPQEGRQSPRSGSGSPDRGRRPPRQRDPSSAEGSGSPREGNGSPWLPDGSPDEGNDPEAGGNRPQPGGRVREVRGDRPPGQMDRSPFWGRRPPPGGNRLAKRRLHVQPRARGILARGRRAVIFSVRL